jgi:UPF0755 protein
LKRFLEGAALVLLLLGLGAVGAWRWTERELAKPHAFGATGEARTLAVPAGESSRAILARLESAGILRSQLLTRLYLVRVLGDPPLLAGEYRFVSPISALEALRKLRSGDVVTYPVTIVEGWTYFESAAALAAAGFGDRAALLAEVTNPARIRELDPRATTLEGYLYPDTYRFPRGTAPGVAVDVLVAAFRRHWEREVRPLLAPGDKRTLRELVILASLVEKETARAEERPLVAAVYANRLRRGMGLFADPTLIYGLRLAGRWDGDLRRRDLQADSPWNSYLRAGLPPGPICSPGLASLASAARPATTEFLYFVSRNDGSHVFSTGLAEHNRNV